MPKAPSISIDVTMRFISALTVTYTRARVICLPLTASTQEDSILGEPTDITPPCTY
jgi:hypothetical protein